MAGQGGESIRTWLKGSLTSELGQQGEKREENQEDMPERGSGIRTSTSGAKKGKRKGGLARSGAGDLSRDQGLVEIAEEGQQRKGDAAQVRVRVAEA